MRNMVLMNLTAHRMRNKMTSIIYSIALGFIIFLIVVYNLQLKSIQLMQLKSKGAYFRISVNGQYDLIKPETFDPILQSHYANISSFSYVLAPIKNDA